MLPFDDALSLCPLPEQVKAILQENSAPPRLVAHLTLVHDVAFKLVAVLQDCFPQLVLDRDSVLFGAATHDIGKALHPGELTAPGNKHELAGTALLRNLGLSNELARFARTHAAWSTDKTLALEDYLVALADTCWKGKRVAELDDLVATRIAATINKERWEVFLMLDDILQGLTGDADRRLAWQSQFAPLP